MIDPVFKEQFDQISELSYAGKFVEAHEIGEALSKTYSDQIILKFCLARLKVALGKPDQWLLGLELFDSLRGHGVFGGQILTQKKPLIPYDKIDKTIYGKKIFIALEGGFGDQICFSRFANDLTAMGANVIIGCDPELFSLLRTLNSKCQLVDVKAIDAIDFDYWLPSLSLPRLLNLLPEQISGKPYLSSTLSNDKQWSAIWNNLGLISKPRIGLVWQGNPKFKEDSYRSIQGHLFKQLIQNQNFHFVTHQSYHPDNQLIDTRLTDISQHIQNPSDLAGYCKSLDLLISVDSGPAHLASALGVPTLLVNRIFGWFIFSYDYTPGLQKTDWYNSMILLNQKNKFSWDHEIDYLNQNLDGIFSSLKKNKNDDQIYHPENPTPSTSVIQSVKTKYGEILTMPNDFFVGQALNTYGEYSFHEAEMFKNHVKPGHIVLDIGAQLGAHSLEFCELVGKNGQVIAIEPQKIFMQIINMNKNLLGLDQLNVLETALSSKEETLYLPKVDYQRVGNFGSLQTYKTNTSQPSEKLLARTIDEIVFNDLKLDLVNFIKMDIEGMELEALSGASKTISTYRPILFIEVDRLENSEKIIHLIQNLGYKTEIFETVLFNENNYNGVKTNIFGQAGTRNLLAIPS